MDAFQKLKKFADVCEEVAAARGIPICVTVLDAHNNPVLLHRMPGSGIITLEMAERKAYTSVALGCETYALKAGIQPGQPLYSLTTSSSRLIAFGGGTCVRFGSEVFGIGISGGPTEVEDMEILRDARIKFGDGEWAPDSMGTD
ncbi:heme-binding protein [Planosporangium flavigriseum]|uniref:Heme-binding protein n=1 Tax=Planosporangium flavigriseum TaxID=373681 RepID=A0A8J3LZZ8_9ACTN|nr:heme-binding protein [Planosporangium flavigriseum]NJC67462.1 heme-binding protein [Planosporangium flavigriseum]GIG76854.1 hypothetical protein Pfl04_52580 [Planosporangium flavigriseum]